MKKYVTISIFIFFVITTAVLVAGLINYDKNNQSEFNSNTGGVNQIDKITGVNSGTTFLTLSNAELVKHNSRKSCWLLISGKIYDVTTFLDAHPGNASAILPTCGTDATAAYATRGGNGSHSSSATAMLADYYIGDLNQTVQTSAGSPTTPTIANPSAATNPPASRGGDDDLDDD